MKTIDIKFVGPKILNITPVHLTVEEICEFQLLLDWGPMGLGSHRIYKKDGQWVWTDSQSPLPVRSFDSLTDLMWEYELPETLKEQFEKLVESK